MVENKKVRKNVNLNIGRKLKSVRIEDLGTAG